MGGAALGLDCGFTRRPFDGDQGHQRAHERGDQSGGRDMRRNILTISLIAVALAGCGGRQPSGGALQAPPSAAGEATAPTPAAPSTVSIDKLAVALPNGERGFAIRITSHVASITVNKAVLNKGNCTTTTKFPETIKSGEFITVATSPGCNPTEVRLETDQGSYAVSFGE